MSSYKIYRDKNSSFSNPNAFHLVSTKLVSESLVFTMASDITTGEYYQFYVVSANSIGDSAQSEIIKIMAASAPTAPSVFATVAQSTTSITFNWSEPDNGGDPISDYEIDWN